MDATTVAVDLAKAGSSNASSPTAKSIWSSWKPAARRTSGPSARHAGLPARLLPPQHVRRYVLRSKTDATDCAALLDAQRATAL